MWGDNKERAILILIAHNNWIKTEPITFITKDGQAYRSIIQTWLDIEAKQVRINLLDITAVIIRLSKHVILLISVYI